MDEKLILDKEENKSSVVIIPESYNDFDNIIEKVRELNNVNYYFALKGNSPDNTIKAINAFNKKIILITGGNDENMSYDSLGDTLVTKVKHLILIGQTSGLIEMSLMRKLVGKNQGIDIRITHCNTLRQAVDCACLSAKHDDTVLLSLASSCISEQYSELKEVYAKFVGAL
ncbi:MAG: hypothetical protein GX625_01645 [Clostridiaceae bacterium]|nr:hypothetical protein [Clostridiaceae bacterium]